MKCTSAPDSDLIIVDQSACNLSTPACNASGLQTFHPKLCEASSVVELMKPHDDDDDSTTDEASQSLGWNVWRPEALQAGVLRLHAE